MPRNKGNNLQRAIKHWAAMKRKAEAEKGPSEAVKNTSQTAQANIAPKDVVYCINIGPPASPTISTNLDDDVPMDNVDDHGSTNNQSTTY
jgi:hypothetical protein